MTRRWPRLEAAEDAYLAHRRLPDMLQEAVEHGEKLTDVTLAEQLGVVPRPAPPGVER